MEEADRIIAALGLVRHPEGGWYRQTWAAPAAPGQRPAGTAIHFLLRRGESSRWHRVDAHEVWLWHAGGARSRSRRPRPTRGRRADATLGPDVLAGQSPQLVVPAGWWQSARPEGNWALVSCVVCPGFRFAGFELAPEGFEIPHG